MCRGGMNAGMRGLYRYAYHIERGDRQAPFRPGRPAPAEFHIVPSVVNAVFPLHLHEPDLRQLLYGRFAQSFIGRHEQGGL